MREWIKPALDRKLSGAVMTAEMRLNVMNRLPRERIDAPGKRRMRVSAALIAAIVLLVALAGLAVAMQQSQILRWLFSNAEPSEQASQLVKSEREVVEQDGIRVSMTESLVDVDAVYVTWRIEWLGDGPVLLDVGQLNTVYLGEDAAQRVAIYDDGMLLLGGGLDGAPDVRSLQVASGSNRPVGQGPISIPCELEFYRPMGPLKRRPSGGGHDALYPDDGALYFSKEGVTGQFNYRAVREGNADDNVIMEQYWDDPEHMPPLKTPSERMAERGLIAPHSTIAHQFSVAPDPDKVATGTRVIGQNHFDFDEYTLFVTQMNFAATYTHIEMALHPKRPLQSDPNNWAFDPIHRQYAFLREDGTDVLDGLSGGAALAIGTRSAAASCIGSTMMPSATCPPAS